jgi:NADH:ubiquinone oxidoreductase subunit 5 (subunit L)/multisubunit Na+/H+ antiporter MnhA subunit
VVRLILPWMPQFGLELNFRLDGYAWLFAMLVAFMGVLVVLYARYYMSSADPVPRFFSFLLAFMGAMLGTVLSGGPFARRAHAHSARAGLLEVHRAAGRCHARTETG